MIRERDDLSGKIHAVTVPIVLDLNDNDLNGNDPSGNDQNGKAMQPGRKVRQLPR